MFDAIATVVDAHAKPLTNDDDRSTPERQAEALADACGHVLDHGDIPESGGHRPRVNVLIWRTGPTPPAWPRGPVARSRCARAVLRRARGADRDERSGPTRHTPPNTCGSLAACVTAGMGCQNAGRGAPGRRHTPAHAAAH